MRTETSAAGHSIENHVESVNNDTCYWNANAMIVVQVLGVKIPVNL